MIEVKQCKSCGAGIVWMKNSKTDKWSPVDAETVDSLDLEFNSSKEPLFERLKGHVSHFATCENRDKHRGQGRVN